MKPLQITKKPRLEKIIALRLSPELLDKLKTLCQKHKSYYSEIIRTLLENAYEEAIN